MASGSTSWNFSVVRDDLCMNVALTTAQPITFTNIQTRGIQYDADVVKGPCSSIGYTNLMYSGSAQTIQNSFYSVSWDGKSWSM